MKKYVLIFMVFLFSFGSFWLGKNFYEEDKNLYLKGIILSDLANTLIILRSFDTNAPDEAKHLLQAETAGKLSWFIDLKEKSKEKQPSKEECKLLNTLKQYREKHSLFKTPDWNDLLRDPEMKEGEEKRVKYLNNLSCRKDVFFKIP